MENGEDGGSEQPRSLHTGQSLSLRKMKGMIESMVFKIVPRALKPMVISIVQEVIGTIVEVSLRKVVQEEIQKLEEKGLTGRTRNDLPKERTLQLKFLDKVSDTTTGGVLEGTEDKSLKLALFDSNGDRVSSGDGSSAEVEILILISNSKNGEDDMAHENFAGSIIPTGEKKKPHFAKRVYIPLKNGVGDLSGLKLGHGPYSKSCKCRLGARIAQNFRGITVQEAWTSPFNVIDKRDRLYLKHIPPYLTSDAWRLKGIDRTGKRCKRLETKKIKTLQDFLFWLSVKPEELEKIYLGPCRSYCEWNTTVAHAEDCIIDDKKIYYYKSSTEPQICVIYDVVGKLKGVTSESHFVPIDKLSADIKDHALKLLRSILEPSAFGQRYENFFNDETSLLQQFPSISSEIDAFSNAPIWRFLNGKDLALSENIHGCQTTGPSDSLGAICDTRTDPDYEKRETLSLSDDVSRLVNICKDGEVHKCLRDNKISTVEDFLIRLLRDYQGLKRMVNLEELKWDATVSNAQACPTGSRIYCYTNLEQKTSVIFNVLGNVLGLCFEKYFVPTGALPERLLKVDAQDLLARARENWRNVKPVDDMNHLEQHLSSGGGNEINAAEIVGELSSSPSNASFLSTSSTLKPLGETQDFGSSDSAIDQMETAAYDAETRNDAAWQCSRSDNFEGVDDFWNLEGMGDFMRQNFPDLYAESQVVSNSWNWKQLLCVIKWWFSIRRRVPRAATRKRKR